MDDWRKRARARQSTRRLTFYILVLLLMLTWLGATALAWWMHSLALGPPTVDRLGAMFLGLGGVLFVAFKKWRPTLPFRGRAPEEEAAKAFIAGEQVRSDDHRFETDLKP